MAAVMSSDMDNTDKVVTFINESKQMNLNVLPPSVNSSNLPFTVINEQGIIYGLAAIKGVGESAIACLVAEREQNGSFSDLFEFCKRLDLRKVNRRVLEALIKSGAMDEWQQERSVLIASLEKALKMAEKAQQNHNSGQVDLFTLFEDESNDEDYISCKPWPQLQRLDGEKATLGLYLTGHPAAQYADEFKSYVVPIARLNPSTTKKAWVCGQITSIRRIITKRGKKLTILSLEDATSKLDIVVFSEIYDALTAPIVAGQIMFVEGEIANDDFSGGVKMTANQLIPLEEARTRFAKCLMLSLTPENEAVLSTIKSFLTTHKGSCPVQIKYSNNKARVLLNLALEWSVLPGDNLISTLRDILGDDNVKLHY